MKNETDTLNETIVELGNQQAEELKSIILQFYETYERLKPINLLKSSLQEVSSSSKIKQDLLHQTLRLALDYLSKRFLMTASKHLIKKNAGTFLQIGMFIIIVRNSDTIITNLESLIKQIFNPKS